MALFNLARMTVSSSGTGTITLGAAVQGFLTFDLAGCSTASTGQLVTYAIADTTQSEIGHGTYTSSALSLSRGPLSSTNSGSPIAMSNAAQVFITFAAQDVPLPDGTTLINTSGVMSVANLGGVLTGTVNDAAFQSSLQWTSSSIAPGTITGNNITTNVNLNGQPAATSAIAPGASDLRLATTSFANPGGAIIGNGFVELPSGLYIQWGPWGISGGHASNSIVFPANFPNAVFVVTVTPNATDPLVIGVTNPTLSGFTINSVGTSGIEGWFIAIGN